MNRNLIIGIIAVVVLASGVLVYMKNSNAPAMTNTTVYCSSDGTLTATQSIQSHRSYCFQSLTATDALQPVIPSAYSFRIVDDQGNVLKDFDTVHEKVMHFIVVRKDLAEFQHVHPGFNTSTGVFTLSDLTFPSDGIYRLFADFTPTAAQMGPDGMKLAATTFQDVNVGDLKQYSPQPIGTENTNKTFGQYQISLALQPAQITVGNPETLTFTIQKDGKQVTNLEQYLGALGHAIILRQDSLDFIHAHASGHDMSSMNMSGTMSHTNQEGMTMNTGGPTINFDPSFPEPGNYKIFLQFQHEGTVITADFVVNVQ